MSRFDEWVDAKPTGEGVTWNPCSFKEDGETRYKKANENSFLVGYYLGMKMVKNKEQKDVILHEFQLDEVGQESDIEIKGEAAAPTKGSPISVWGRTQLDDILTKNVVPGQLVMLQYEGRKATKDGSRKFHSFVVKVHPTKRLEVEATEPSKAMAPSKDFDEPQPKPSKAKFDDFEDDGDDDF
jgi:hypothetical protein